MRVIKRHETQEVEALRILARYRHAGTCGNVECKAQYEASWKDLEGFADPESYVHVHCPVCGEPNIITITEEDQFVIDWLRGQNTSTLASEPEEDDDDENE